MTINGSNRNIADTVLDITAMKARLLLADHDVRRLATRHKDLGYLMGLIDSEPDGHVRIRGEELEEQVIILRKALGNIPSVTSPYGVLIETNRRLVQQGYDVDSALPVINQLIAERAVNDTKRAEALCNESNVNPLLVAELLLMHANFQDLSIVDAIGSASYRDWNGTHSLGELFSSELVPKSSESYFDQKFINYLKENGQDLHEIHWRNFERLVAQFFKGNGYEVSLGPGSKDGGVDIRVWKDSESRSGPPLILIQCKRYSKGRVVAVDSVKAFYSDVLHEKADVGLITTTSKVSGGGKLIISSRGYNITVAESEQIKQMIYGMWRASFQGA